MASTPQTPARPAAPPAKPSSSATPAAPAEPKAAPEPNPPVKTAADEQRERSQEIQDKGVEAFKAEHDQRDPADRPRQVAGVAKVEAASAERSTPEARAAQHRTAP